MGPYNQVVSQKMFGLHGLITPGKEESLKTNGGLMYYQYDGLNTVSELTNRNGDIIEKYRYDAFGNIVTGITAPYNKVGYTGQEYDDKSGLINMNARWYDPNAGRFMTQDTYMGTLTEPLSQNLYSYVLNNPVNMIDPSGNIPSWVGSSHSESPSFDEVYNMSLGSTFYKEKWNYQSSYSNTSELRLVSTVKYDKETHYYYSGSRKKTWVYEYIKEARKILNKGTHESGGRWYSHKKIGTTTSTITYSSTSSYDKTIIETAAEQASRNEEIKQSLGEPPEDMEPTWTVTAVNGEVENGSEILLDFTSTKPDEKEKVKTAILQTELNKVLNTNLEIDGWYGNKTKSAVEELQKSFGIDPSGKFDKQTLFQLEMALESTSNEVFVQDNRNIPKDNSYDSGYGFVFSNDYEMNEGINPTDGTDEAGIYNEFKTQQLFESEGLVSDEGTGDTDEEIWDEYTVGKLELLHQSIREAAKKVILDAQKNGINIRITSGLRTIEEQNELYRKGRDEDGNIIDKTKIVTNVKGGHSYHNYGLAFDVVEIVDGKSIWNNDNWSKIGEIGKKYGFEWGGNWTSFKDRPHFQMTFGFSTIDLLRKHNEGLIDKNGYVIVK